MNKLHFKSAILALAALTAGGVEAQTVLPSAGDEWRASGGVFHKPQSSGRFNPMRLTTQDVAWDGSGAVRVPFTMNQRGTVWLAIYRRGSTETGPRGPNGAWVRVVPQDLFMAITPRQSFEAGSNTLTWDGKDWQGNPAGPGSYEFDLIAINDLDEVVLAGPGDIGAWAPNIIDTRMNPPEIWVSMKENPPDEVIRGTLGTDYIANPNAFERWSIVGVFTFEGARNRGGAVPDDQDPQVWWTAQMDGANGGLYKLRRNDAAKSFELDTSFGDNGRARPLEDRMGYHRPWKDVVYVAHWGRVTPARATVEAYDKTTGELVREGDVGDFFLVTRLNDQGAEVTTAGGPNLMAVNEAGIWLSSHGTANYVHVGHDLEVKWANLNGDGIGDKLSVEEAAALGMATGFTGDHVGIAADPSGKISIANQTHNSTGFELAVHGRDGTGLFLAGFASAIGPFGRGSLSKHMLILREGGPYDGMYITSGASLISGNVPKEDPTHPSMLLHVPYDLASGRLGASATVVEEVGGASLPAGYALGNAYPNPFNPETTIEFSVPAGMEERVRVEVYNTAGQRVATLVDEALGAGAYRTRWDGRDAQGSPVASGVYYCRMEAGTFAQARAMALMK